MAIIPSPLPLCERVAHKNTVERAMYLTVFFLLLSLLTQRLLSMNEHGLPWFIAFLSESWFTLMWVLSMNAKWSPMEYKTYPERLSHWVSELPPLDMLVTTADPILEPPILTVNTVLSLLAVDYPAHKLACYVSDDAGSALNFYSLVEASKYAKLWVPFCKKYKVQLRAPFRHFSEENNTCLSDHLLLEEFHQERKKMKDEYDELIQKIERATQNRKLCDLSPNSFGANVECKNHGSIVTVIWENKEELSDGLPSLVYIAREKRPKHPDHYKAGAMNVLTRVSGLMTNAPFMLNVDCDMYANNPQIVLDAMCFLLGLNENESGFVQCPQYFYNAPSEEMRIWQQTVGRGCMGLQGPVYQGTGCFHRRKAIYGSQPLDQELKGQYPSFVDERLAHEDLQKSFGMSLELNKSVSRILSRLQSWPVCQTDLSNLIDQASTVAACGYEYGTDWGKQIGWMYGSTVEDILTGSKIHERGWKSILFAPDPPAFLGLAPLDVPSSLTQQKRWATGLLENLFTRQNYLSATLFGRLQFRQCLVYLSFSFTTLSPISDLSYAVLPAYCIITNSYFLPKGVALSLPIACFVIYKLCTLLEYLRLGATARTWWEAHKMLKINFMTAWLFGAYGVLTKLLGLSELAFDITHKGQAAPMGNDGFTFNESPVFVPATFVSMVQLMALFTVLLRFRLPICGQTGWGIGEMACCVWVLLHLWAFVEGLFRKGRRGIPVSTIFKSAALALHFLLFCKWTC